MIGGRDRAAVDEPHLAQIAWAVLDLPRACRFYTDVLGFRRAGGRVLWGPGLSVLQELGDDAAATLWWAVGGQRFVRHVAAEATWKRCSEGYESRDTGIRGATGGLASVRVLRGFPPALPLVHHGEFLFLHVLNGDIEGGGVEDRLAGE